MKFELLPEPRLEFGDDFICDDPKKGISVGGFFSLTNQTHRSEIRLSIVGTKNNIQDCRDWIDKMGGYIEATAKDLKLDNEASIQEGEVISNDEDDDVNAIAELFGDTAINEEEPEFAINKKLNPDFIGFSKESSFKCEFLNDELNNVEVRGVDVDAIIASDMNLVDKCTKVIEVYKAAFLRHKENLHTKPDVCIIIIPSVVFKKLASIPFEGAKLNFRRKLKAEILQCESEIPVQLVLEDTILGKKRTQDGSMIAWNFVVAQYYKSDSIPWALTDIDKDSCFVGISFHSLLGKENNLKRSSIAQAFNREGKGLIYVGKQFEWDDKKTKVRAPHLTYGYAKNLIHAVIDTYVTQNRNLKPRRVVIHKTTDFWNSAIHKDYAEVEGLKDGIRQALGEDVEIDLVTIKDSSVKIFRTAGKYPVIRGTMFEIDKTEGVLYTTGYIPYYETFPGMHMPLGKSVQIFEGETTLRNVCSEIMALTKVNFNNCNYYDGLPITLRFAQKVGEIIQYLPEGFTPPSKYYYYM